MEKNRFENNLRDATKVLLPFSQTFLVDTLPENYLYLIFPNCSYDGNPLHDDEETFPQDSSLPNISSRPMNALDVISFLWRNDKVPEWINVSVHSCDDSYTYVSLSCCGRFTAQQDMLYHEREGYPPFHVLGPALPPRWEGIEKSGKFKLNWLEELQKKKGIT